MYINLAQLELCNVIVYCPLIAYFFCFELLNIKMKILNLKYHTVLLKIDKIQSINCRQSLNFNRNFIKRV